MRVMVVEDQVDLGDVFRDFLVQLGPVRALGVPIVAVSGVVNESQARECLKLGAADFMGKPVQLDRLNEVLTFLEPHAMSRVAELERRPENRRSTRARLALPARLCEYNGREHEGTMLEVGLSGMKARFGASFERDAIGKAVFTPSDAGLPIEVISILVRVDPDGQAFTFVRLDPRAAERLRDLIRRSPA